LVLVQNYANLRSNNNEGKSAASFCRQMAAWVTRYVLQLLLSEKSQNCKKNSTTTKAREKISTDLESLEF